MSTISPHDSVACAKLVSEKGGLYIDAPVSGSVGAAKSSQLVILVGGEDEAIETCRPYFNALSKETIHFGTNGKGSSAKENGNGNGKGKLDMAAVYIELKDKNTK